MKLDVLKEPLTVEVVVVGEEAFPTGLVCRDRIVTNHLPTPSHRKTTTNPLVTFLPISNVD